MANVPDIVKVGNVEFRRHYVTPATQRIVCQAVVDDQKVCEIAEAISRNEALPRAIVAKYGDSFMPIDGHHRAFAAKQENRILYAWVCDGDAYDDLSCRLGSYDADRIILRRLQRHVEAGY